MSELSKQRHVPRSEYNVPARTFDNQIIIIIIIIIIITTNSHTGHCTHTAESTDVKMQ
jgi:xanthine/uracil permease